jgi:hypothetical protein
MYKEAPVDGKAKEASGCDLRVLRGGYWSYSPAEVALRRP